MKNEFTEISGKWNFPALEDEEYFGTLKYSNSYISLEIFDQLRCFNKIDKFDVVVGKTLEGTITLLDCIRKGNRPCVWTDENGIEQKGISPGSISSNGESNIITTRLSCYSIIKHHCFKSKDEIKFNKFLFNFDGLREWLDYTTVTINSNSTRIEANYKKPETIHFNINEDIEGRFEFDVNTANYKGTDKDIKFQINLTSQIILESKKETKKDKFLEIRNKLLDFFTFAINLKQKPYLQRFFNNKIKNQFTSDTLIFLEVNQGGMNKLPDNHLFTFKYSHIKTNFNKIIENWFSKYEKLKPIINLWTTILIRHDIISLNKFIFVCQALETYHARFRHEIETYTNNELKNYGPKLKVRMRKLLEYFDDETKEKEYIENFKIGVTAEQISNTRNYYTHYNEKYNNKMSEIEIGNVTPRLIQMLQFLILRELDIEYQTVKEYMEYPKFTRITNLVDIKSVEEYNND